MLFAGRGQSASRRGLLFVLPIHGRGWSSPFMGRWRAAPEGLEELFLPIYGEVARSAGGAGGAVPPHSWGAVGAADRGDDPNPYQDEYHPNSDHPKHHPPRPPKAASA